MSNKVKVSHVRGVVLGAPNATRSAQFYQEVWGLPRVAEQDGVVYLRGNIPEHHILALEDRPEMGLVALELGADDQATVLALHDKAVAMGVEITQTPAKRTVPGGGFGFEMIDIDGRTVRVSSGVAEHAPGSEDPMAPDKVSHVVLNTTDIDRSQQFYSDLFGFVVSDWSAEQMVFIRANNAHHNIAFNKNPYVSVNHISFEMSSFDAVMRGVGKMGKAGLPMKWGTGCHGVGHIMFAYFIDPNGFTIEYSYYIEAFDESRHEPRRHVRTPENMDAWGTSGPPSAEIRAAMAGPAPADHARH